MLKALLSSAEESAVALQSFLSALSLTLCGFFPTHFIVSKKQWVFVSKMILYLIGKSYFSSVLDFTIKTFFFQEFISAHFSVTVFRMGLGRMMN